jgi:RNA polymerase sigma factor (sigma-70 family)
LHDLTDRELVDRFLSQKDEEAFRQLYRRHTPRVYALVLRLVGGRRHEADDAVQEAWLRASRRVHAFEWRSALLTWLSSIAIHCALEAIRRHPPGRDVELDVASPAQTVAPELSLDLDRAIAALPDGYRTAIVLHDIEGFTHAEIAATLGVTEGTSRSQLFHARRALRAALPPARR